MLIVRRGRFSWDATKDKDNRRKHGVSFFEAIFAFQDPDRVIAEDLAHSTAAEPRYYCFGRVRGEVMTVRFTYRNEVIRIFGAGFWRKGRRFYEQENQIH